MWDLIVSAPDHCLSFYFRKMPEKLVHLYKMSSSEFRAN